MFHCIKWQHIFESNIVPASNDGTMKHNFSWCSTESTTLTCSDIWPRQPQRDFIIPSNIRLQTHTLPTILKNFVKLLQFSLAETAQYVRQCSWCCMQGISLLVTPAAIWPPNLWMCLVIDSGLFIFLTQILILSYSVAVLSYLYLAWIQDLVLQMTCQTHFGSLIVCCHIFKQQVQLCHVLICLCHKGL